MAGNDAEKLFDKKYTCPICENEFTAKTVKSGKARLLKTEMDLRNIYEGIEPLKYDVILCPKCGYAALARFFATVTAVQEKYITEKITPNFKAPEDEGPPLEEAPPSEEAPEDKEHQIVLTVTEITENGFKGYITDKNDIYDSNTDVTVIYKGEKLPESCYTVYVYFFVYDKTTVYAKRIFIVKE